MNRALPMFTHPLLMIRPILMVCALLLAMASMAQGRFTVNGRMKVDGSDMSGTRVVVYKNGVKERTLTSGLAKFSLDLDLQASYILSFEKDGFVAKKLSFNTKVPGDAAGDAFTPFDFAVSIFKQYDDVNIVVFNQPVGVIRYEAGMGDFDYDTDYTKSIQSQLQQTLAAVERKQKEEASKDEEEARNKERLVAEAKKQAELQAKADQAKAQAALKAEKEQAAAQARQEAEARKAAQLVQTQKVAPAATVPVAVVATPPGVIAERKPPAPKPEPRSPAVPRDGVEATAHEGGDQRRTTAPVVQEEMSPVAMARRAQGEETRPENVVEEDHPVRHEELVVEPTKVMTIVRLEKGGTITEYRKVFHKWGGTFYFRNGEACSQLVYEQEARPEQLAGATPRGKLD